MATTQPPPAYSGDIAPPAASSVEKVTGQNPKIYWIYWGTLFASPLTWVLALAATVNEEWFTNLASEASYGGHHGHFCSDIFLEEAVSVFDMADEDVRDLEDMCSTFTAASVMQFVAIALVSVVLFLVVAAALRTAPTTGKLGLAAGTTLAVFSVFQLIVFSLAASVAKTYEEILNRNISADEKVGTGPSSRWAIASCLFGLIGAITVLVLRTRATSDQDGPFTQSMSNAKAYWIYWGVLFATPLTWVLALAATVNMEWITNDQYLASFGGFEPREDWFCDADHKAYMIYFVSYTELHTVDEMCSAFAAAKTMQYVAITLVSVVLVLAVAAALQTARMTGKLGLAAGITLALFSVFELIAFSLMASVVQKFKDVHATFYTENTFSAGPSLGWAVVACVFGLAGAIAVLVLRARATTEQDGPFKKCGTTVGPSAAPAVGTV